MEHGSFCPSSGFGGGGFGLALSSTAVVVEVLAEQKRLTSTTGRTAFSILLLQDLAVVPILFMVETLGGGGGLGRSVWIDLGYSLLQGLVAVAVISHPASIRPFSRVCHPVDDVPASRVSCCLYA